MYNTTTHIPNAFQFSFTLRFGSGNVNFADWIALLTVCLAPLLAHIIAGAPQPVYLHPSRPRWHDTIVHYNPTSIVWRYFAIIDRRIRARNWDTSDLAASNTVFWTTHGWDGSEDMLAKARLSGIRAPSKIERLFSLDTFKTIIVTLQGAQAVYTLVRSWFMSLETLFMPLAIIGLLRLPAAAWLTDERFFVDRDSHRAMPTMRRAPPDVESGNKGVSNDAFLLTPQSTFSYSKLEVSSPAIFHKSSSFRGTLIRLFYLVFLLGAVVLWMTVAFPEWFYPVNNPNQTPALSEFLAVWFYGLWLFISIIIYTTYSVTRRSKPTTTVIPCISTVWYKIFTCIVLLYITVLIVICILETRRLSCGATTVLGSVWDQLLCDHYLGKGLV